MIRGIIFDLGSTLLYNTHDNNWGALRPRMIADLAINLRAQGLTFNEPEFTQAFLQNIQDFDQQRQTHFKEVTTEYILHTTFAQLKLNTARIDFAQALQAFFAYSETTWQAMPYVHETLARLQPIYKLAIVSNAADNANVQRLVEAYGLRPYFEIVIVSAAVGIRKPNPRIFDSILHAWHYPPSELVMIGDTLGADVLGAKNAGLKSIWVTMQADTPYNQAHRETIIPDASAETLRQLPELVQKL